MLLLTAAVPAAAVDGGPLGVVHIGHYICERPGDVTGVAGRHESAEDFSIGRASTYSAAEGGGTYLLTGGTVTMTSGPRRGWRYAHLTENFMRKLNADGSQSDLRCVRGVPNNS